MLAMRLARAYDAADESEARFRRIATAVAKYWVCKRAAPHVGEALECLGGNGFVEDSIMPRLYRESPLNSIWEGSGNVICLDVLRAIGNEPGTIEALLAEIDLGRGARSSLDAYAAATAQTMEIAGHRPAARPAAGRTSGAGAASFAAWCGSRRPRWPMRSAPRAWPAIGATPSARCRAGSPISTRSSSEPCPQGVGG